MYYPILSKEHIGFKRKKTILHRSWMDARKEGRKKGRKERKEGGFKSGNHLVLF